MATSGKKFGNALVFKLDLQGGASLTDISAYVKSVDGLPGELDLGDVTVGGSTGYKWLRGLGKADISLECVFDDTASSAYDVAKNFMSDTTTRSFEYGPAGSTAGYAKVNGECVIKNIKLPAKATDPLLFTVSAVVDGAITIGVWT